MTNIEVISVLAFGIAFLLLIRYTYHCGYQQALEDVRRKIEKRQKERKRRNECSST